MAMMDVKEVAEYLGLSERTVYKMVRSEEIPVMRIGGVYRFDRAGIDEWLKKKGAAGAKKSGVSDVAKSLDRIIDEPDLLTKRLLFIGLLTKELAPQNITPVIVGGNAVEFYTAGGYATADLDIVCPGEPLDKVLKSWGLEKEGRHWFSEKLGIVVEAPASFLDADVCERVTVVDIEGLTVSVIGLEDIIIDRLNAFVHWRSTDDRGWAKELIALHVAELDMAYLRKKAKRENVLKALDEIFTETDKK